MNKYLVTVIVPMLGVDFDMQIPNNRKVGTIKKVILDFLKERYNNVFQKAFDDVRLIDRYYGFEYDNDMYIKDSKIKNGTLLVVI